jgi:hypothetical protein
MAAVVQSIPKKGLDQYRVVSSKDDQKRHVFCALVKRTYDIRFGGAVRAAKDRPFDLIDVYYDAGDPETCSVQYENDLTPFKVGTDVVVVGNVYAPAGRPTEVFDVSVAAGSAVKQIRVFGDRQCFYNGHGAPTVTDPQPVLQLPMRYERAYGGTDTVSIPETLFAYPRNHLGRGFVLSNSPQAVHGLALPNFEDPHDLLTPERIIVGELENWWRQPMPQGSGWFQRTWYPRCSFAGSVPGFVDPDVVIREEQLGLVPRQQFKLARQFKLPSFDVRFNSGASPGLTVPFLAGGEQIRLSGLTREGQLAFRLPVDTPKISVNIGLGGREPVAVLQTVLVRTDDAQIDLIWRGAHEFPGIDWLPEMKCLLVEVE